MNPTSKKATATTIYQHMKTTNPETSRAEIIEAFQRHAGLTKAGASTYYQQIHKTAQTGISTTSARPITPQPHRIPQDIRDRVKTLTRQCIELAETHYGRSFKMPKIVYKFVGSAAGQAQHSKWTTWYQGDMLMENIDNNFIEETVPHEIAHLIDREVNGPQYLSSNGRGKPKRSVHGPTWKAVMRVFGVNPDRTHSFGISTVKRKTKTKYTYDCGCGPAYQLVGPKVHKKIQMGAEYRCRKCGHRLAKDSGMSAGRLTYEEHKSKFKISTSA